MTGAVGAEALDRLADDGAPVGAPDAPLVGARLVWAAARPRRGLGLAGAWWPRTRDASRELTTLLAQVDAYLGGPVTRVSLNIDAWSADQPRRLYLPGRIVRVGWFRTLDPASVTLGRGTHDRLALLVIPPDLDEHRAAELMAGLADSTSESRTSRRAPGSAGRRARAEGSTR